MKIKFSRIENAGYFCIWIFSIGYAINQTYKVGNEYFSNFHDVYNDFLNGWSWLGRKKDDSDNEWRFGQHLLLELLPWYCIHTIVAELLKKQTNNQFLAAWYCGIGILFSIHNLGYRHVIVCIFQPLFCYFAAQFKSKAVIWICNMSFLCAIYYDWFQDFKDSTDYELHIKFTATTWIHLRCLNYFLEAVTNTELQKINLNNILTVFAYCFYLPTLFLGPLLLFTDFKNIFEYSDKELLTRIKDLFLSLLRFGWWILFIEFALHIIYVSAIPYHPQLVNKMNPWALYGLGYCMGQFFHMKYVVFYGISTSFAAFEGISVPNIPKCIGRIHLYSDMWKYFDRGLYLFLLRYIYLPITGTKKSVSRRICGSFFCFLYVYIWHGVHTFVAIWAFLNFLGITIEAICSEISQTKIYEKIVKKNMSPQMHRRLTCALVSPLFAMSALSNFYFFAGKEVGDIYVYRFFQGSFSTMLIVLSVLYCGSHISLEVKNWERCKILAKKQE